MRSKSLRSQAEREAGRSRSGERKLGRRNDDILVTGSDAKDIEEIKEHLRTHFVIKDIGKPRYFLGIKFAYGNGKMALSQRKYVLDLL